MLSKTSYSAINDKFLIRGLPVIVSDAIKNPDNFQTPSSFIDNIYANMSDMINADACNFETNLMMSQYAKLDKAIGIARKLMEDEEISPWFISFRNCKQKAVEYFEGLFNDLVEINLNLKIILCFKFIEFYDLIL